MKRIVLIAAAGFAALASTSAFAQDGVHHQTPVVHNGRSAATDDLFGHSASFADGPTYTNSRAQPGGLSDRAPDEPGVFLHAEGAHY